MTWKVIAIGLLSLAYSKSGTNGKEKQYEGAKVFNVFHNGKRVLLELIKGAGLEVWFQNRTNTEFMVPYLQLKSVEHFLNSRCIYYSITIANVQELINEQQTSNLPRSAIRAFSLRNYHRLDEIYDWMETLQKEYPDRVSVELVGYSYENRPIKCLKVSSGVPGAKAAFIDGGIHAREWIAPATVLYIINELVNKRDEQSDYIKETDFYLLPVVNTDGYEYTHTTDRLWRKSRSKSNSSCIGVDLNRNFDAHFGGIGTSDDSCSDVYRGPNAFSEPETKALSQYILRIRKQLVAYITFHSYGKLILLPYGHGGYPTDYERLEYVGIIAAIKMFFSDGEVYEVGRAGDILYSVAGDSQDWVKEKAGVKYSYTFELRDDGTFGFLLPAEQILPTAREAFVGVKVIVQAAS